MTHKENVEVVKKYFDENDWHYQMTEHEEVTFFEGGVEHGNKKCKFKSFRYRLIVDDEYVQVFYVLPISAMEKLAEVAEYITRINYTLKRGRFDMDYSDGEVRFHHGMSMIGVLANPDVLLGELMLLGGTVMARYAEGVAKIVYGSADPKVAIEEMEQGG